MFSTAYTIAQLYTYPVIISYRKVNGECGAAIGAFVVINENGWFVTALHIIQQIQELQQSNQQYHETLRIRKEIENDSSIKKGEKDKLLKKNVVNPQAITDLSVWWGGLGNGNVINGAGLYDVDLATGQLEGYIKPENAVYPKFKDPAKSMTPGTSLCKLGFPLQEIRPVFDSATRSFLMPAGTIPVPLFPSDGIFTRIVVVESPTPQSYPAMYIETSTPGLRGQSGGPTFDIHGAIWAIQSKTQHYPLGFGQDQKGSSRQTEFLQNQYLNVGWGIHSETIVGFLNQHNISFDLSPF